MGQSGYSREAAGLSTFKASALANILPDCTIVTKFWTRRNHPRPEVLRPPQGFCRTAWLLQLAAATLDPCPSFSLLQTPG